jgi:hypothetical protein
MKTQPQFTAAQWKQLKQSLWSAASDLEFAIQPVVRTLQHAAVGKNVLHQSLRETAWTALYLTATDAAAGFGVVIPESTKCPKGRLRNLVDSQARRFARKAA